MILEIIHTAVEGLTLTYPNNRRSNIKPLEAYLVQWLHKTEEKKEPAPPERSTIPIPSADQTVPSATTSNAMPSNLHTMAQPSQSSHRAGQPFLGQHAGQHPATYVSNTPATQPYRGHEHQATSQQTGYSEAGTLPRVPIVVAPQPQIIHQPTFLAMGPVLPYNPNGPPTYWRPQSNSSTMQQPFLGPQYRFLPPPQVVRQPLQQPTIMLVEDRPITPPRTSLPPARRQASQSVWAHGKKKFNVAEWAQEHRPRTPHASSNVTGQTTSINNAITAIHTNTTRYGPHIDVMYPRTTGETSQQLRSLTGTEPGYSAVTQGSTFPFEIAITNSKAATGGVIRITNVSRARR